MAPRLQTGLQRFAKPWWKRRALRVFRDESSLSANPHLWASIEAALDGSEWFVLLLSEEAAQSEWVGREIDYWTSNKDTSRILPVVTDGTFAWNGAVAGTSVPPALHGVFGEEPRWVDLRFARGEDSLDLKNPAFSNAVADVASAIRGIPKDELASEEVKQHRRTVRTAWAAGAMLLVLAVAAIGFGVQSANNATRAESEATRANEQAARAEASTEAEAVARQEAETNARKAEAGRLAASALAVLEEDPELSVLLGLEALRLSPDSPETLDSLTEAIQTHRTVFVASPPEGFGGENLAVGSISPDGSLLAASFLLSPTDGTARRGLVVWDTGQSGSVKWLREWEGIPHPRAVHFSNDGAFVIAEVAPEPDASGFDLVVLDADTGDVVHSVTLRCRTGWFAGPAQNGPFLDLSKPILMSALPDDGEGGCESAPQADIVAVDIWTGEETVVGFGPTPWGTLSGMPTLSDDGTRLAVAGDCCQGAVTEVETGEVLLDLPPGLSSLSPDGKFVLAGSLPLELWSVDEAQRLRDFQGDFSVAWFSHDGQLVYGSTYAGNTAVFDRETGQQLHELRGHGGRQVNVQMTSSGSHVGTFSADDTARLWDVGSTISPTSEAPPIDVATGTAFFARGNAWTSGSEVVASIVDLAAQPRTTTFVYDASTGEPLRQHPWFAVEVSSDMTVAAYQQGGTVVLTDDEAFGPGTGGEYDRRGGFVIADLQTGETIVELVGMCDVYSIPSLEEIIPAPECEGYPGLWHDFTQVGAFSEDGSMFAIAGQSGHIAVWNVASGDLMHVHESVTPAWVTEALSFAHGHVEFTPDGRHLALTSGWDEWFGITVLSTDTWEEVASLELTQPFVEMEFTPDGSLLVAGDANADVVIVETSGWTEIARLKGQQGGQINDVALSPDGRLAATAGSDNQILIWDLETQKVANRLTLSRVSFGVRNVDWLDNQTLFMSTRPAAAILTLDPEVIRARAFELLTRGFTEQECATYRINPCPTLEDIRSGSA